jgi:integrase
VLDAAKAKGFRTGENPARWRGHLDHLLPKRQKLTRGHHAAMPYALLPEFLAQLRERNGMGALALEFLILTAARSGEVRGARWSEIDLSAKVWTVPAKRMKGGREHRVPLSNPAIAIMESLLEVTNGAPDAIVFPGLKPSKALSDSTFKALMVRMGVALAHVVGDATERAYRRGDALEKRREMMDGWADFSAGKAKAEAVHGPAVEP